MNKIEIAEAIDSLDDYAERAETAILDTGGQCLTAHWVGGGQKLFYTLRDIQNWIDERQNQQAFMDAAEKDD